MIERACVLGAPEGQDPIVAGMRLSLRTLLALQDAGITTVAWLGVQPPPRDPRIMLRLLSGLPEGPGAALVVPPGVCCSASVLRTLRRTPLPAGAVQGIGVPDAGVWAADASVLPSVLGALQRGEPPPAQFFGVTPPGFVQRIIDESTRREAERRLLATLRKPTDGFTARHLNRALSLPLSAALCRTSISPTAMTVIAFVIGMASVLPLLKGDRLGLIVGALLLQIHSVLDGCDGELARLLHRRSRVGAWADQVSDDVVNLSFLIATGFWLDGAGVDAALPLTVMGASSFVLYQIALYVALWTRGGRSGSVTSLRWWGQTETQHARARIPPWLKAAVEDLLRRDSYTFAYLPCAVLGVPVVAFVWQVLVATISGVVTSAQWLVAGGPEPAT